MGRANGKTHDDEPGAEDGSSGEEEEEEEGGREGEGETGERPIPAQESLLAQVS